MNTVNETGREQGPLPVHRLRNRPVRRAAPRPRDRRDGDDLAQPGAGGHVAFDASYWTPWGTFITAEESWCTAAAGCTSTYGRLFELKNPIDRARHHGAADADEQRRRRLRAPERRSRAPRMKASSSTRPATCTSSTSSTAAASTSTPRPPSMERGQVGPGRLLRRRPDLRAARRRRQHAERHRRLHMGADHRRRRCRRCRARDHHRPATA